ncbi:TNF RECEPTOR-ASSOCIATED FACTOR-like protein 1A [Salix viminalis]|uniref:TNF RECEPTOR-ASSOCIATED FACTOR-like protein 1A n=1 Tax=Salix viminalis TaxID=40686 RepID=A0A9Q0Z575_SALVM|nr:TNF RECEPTOR-ASSOCIATED FACTOR-like protein 1A [Salix viminalis]
MAGTVCEEAGAGRSTEGNSSGQRCQSGELLAEWRSSEQVENGTPSTSPPYWDTDDDDDGGPKPSELFGKFTWKIENFSQINKRELRSDAFKVGGYKWYILIYPQGCDVCNHLSLFLCVANHDKLLPGWSHFAQFTIAVVNKDSKKSKYSDTLHRFWKKEHDWGWKKFMELSKVSDGFLDAADTLIIKAQVQVIREKADRPFRCLDCLYRRELVRVYLTNVEQICRRFVEERRGKLGKLIEDKNRWSSFCAFWLGMDQSARRRMSREKTDVILKVVVKHFFIEKEVTSTLVMDSLYSGLKALEGQTKSKKGRAKLLDAEEMPTPIVRVEKDMFVLVDDVLLLLERAAMEPLPPKDEKGPQNRTKDGSSGEDFNMDSIERDERRLTELGRRTVEIFVLAHIFNHKIEVSYQEAVALKRQEELIREEEAAWLAESEQKAKRGATEKEKKSKKKQAKQKRNNRKGKDKGREDRSGVAVVDKYHESNLSIENKELAVEEVQPVMEKPEVLEDVSDVSDSVDGVAEVLQHDSEDRDASPVNWDTDTSEVHPPTEVSSSGVSGLSSVPNGTSDKRSTYAMDDSSSTCSTDSVPSIVMNGPYKGNSYLNYQFEKLPSRVKNQRGKMAHDASWTAEMDNQPSEPASDTGDHGDVTRSSKAADCELEAVVHDLQDRMVKLEQHVIKTGKEDVVVSIKKQTSNKDQVEVERPKEKTAAVPSSPRSPPTSSPKNVPSTVQMKSESKSSAAMDPSQVKKASSNCSQQADKAATSATSPQNVGIPKPETQNVSTAKQSDKPTQQVPAMSRPSSTPLVPGPRPTAPPVSLVQSTPLLARSASAAGRLGPDPSPATHSYAPQSYRNAIIGNAVGSSSSGFTHTIAPSAGVNLSPVHVQPSNLVSAPMFLPPLNSDRVDPKSLQSGFPFSMVTRDVFQNGRQWMESSQRDVSRIMSGDPSSLINGIQNIDLYNPARSGSQDHYSRKATDARRVYHSSEPHTLNRQFSFPNDLGVSGDLGSSTNSPCRFERTRSYHGGGFQRSYSSSGTHFDTPREYIPQASTLPYTNGHIDGLVSNQWQMAGSDFSLMGMRNADADSSPYFNPEYSNMTCGVNGYTVFRPSNGH